MVEASYKLSPFLESVDVANAVLYALGAPPHVQVKQTNKHKTNPIIRKVDARQVHEITMHPTGEKL